MSNVSLISYYSIHPSIHLSLKQAETFPLPFSPPDCPWPEDSAMFPQNRVSVCIFGYDTASKVRESMWRDGFSCNAT